MDITQLRKQPHLSASSIKNYIECGLLYQLSRVDNLPKPYISDNLIFGSAIHRVLADFNQEKIVGNKLSVTDLQALFEKYWSQAVQNTDHIKYSKNKDDQVLLNQGKQMLKTFIGKVPANEYEVVAVEEPFEFKIDGVALPIIGIMDLVEQDENGTLIITDYKTVSKALSANEIDQNIQLTIYYMAARNNGYADREIVLKLDCLFKTQMPRFIQVYTQRDENHEQRAVKKIKQICKAIDKQVFIPTAEGTWKCNYCDYKPYCDQWFAK